MIRKIQHGENVQINYVAAFLTYILIATILYIIIPTHRPWEAFILGFCIYGIYDLTNLALFKHWDVKLAVLDMCWGGILFAITTTIIPLMH
jgi:uncharacterized membrane protein